MHQALLKRLPVLLLTKQVWRKTLEISSEVFPQNCPGTSPELPEQPLLSSEFDQRYTPKIKWWITESDEPDNTWQRVSVGGFLPPACFVMERKAGLSARSGNKYSRLVGSFYHSVI